MRRAAKRDISEPAIVDALRACGWSVMRVSAKDGPDLFAAKRFYVPLEPPDGAFQLVEPRIRTVAIECKTGTKKLRPGQDEFRKSWQGEYVVLRSVDDILALNGEQG